MKYLTVGTKEIREEYFNKVQDNSELKNVKPRGGLWLTEQRENSKTYNSWVDYILENPRVLYYKNKSSSIWTQPCSLITLKDNTKIYKLDNIEKLNYLINNYPYKNTKFSYEKLSKEYDGFFINIYELLRQIKDPDTREKYIRFSINSLLLFNLECIDYYQSGIVDIEPFELEIKKPIYYYEIIINNEKKKILKR